MNDLISRQDAIDALCSVCGNDCDKTEFVYNAPQWEQVIICPEHYALSTLPSAQPERCEDCVNFSKTRLLIQPAQPEMTTTAITQAKRFCRYQGIMCEYATDMGCCEITGCAKRRVV